MCSPMNPDPPVTYLIFKAKFLRRIEGARTNISFRVVDDVLRGVGAI